MARSRHDYTEFLASIAGLPYRERCILLAEEQERRYKVDQAERADSAATRTGVRTREAVTDEARIAARTRVRKGPASKVTSPRTCTASKSRASAASKPRASAASRSRVSAASTTPASAANKPRASAASQSRASTASMTPASAASTSPASATNKTPARATNKAPASAAIQCQGSAASKARLPQKRKKRQASSDDEVRRRAVQGPAPEPSTASAVRSPAMEKQHAYEKAMAEEEAKMDAAVAKQAEEDSRKRRTKKRLKSMAQTAHLHAVAKGTRASALRSEADGLQQRAAALERLEQRAQNQPSGKTAEKSKRPRSSPNENEAEHDNREDDDDSSAYAGSSSSTSSTSSTGRAGDKSMVSSEPDTTTTATRAPVQVVPVRRDRCEAQLASTLPVPDVNIVQAEELTANGYTTLDSGDEGEHGIDAFDCFEELWSDDAGATGTANESFEDEELDDVFETPDDAGVPRVHWGADIDWSTPIDLVDYDDFVNDEVAFQAMRTDGWELDPTKFPEDTNYPGLYAGEFDPTSSVMADLGTILANKAGKNGYTCHQVWHLEWANGAKRPRPNVGRDIKMRATRVKSSRTRAPDDSAAGAEDFSDEAQSSGDQRRIRGQPRTRRRLIAGDQREGAQLEQGDEALECTGDVHMTAGSHGPTAERQPTSNEIQPSAEIVETANV
ncbi:hypothetical protein PF011_g20693 [Phytophthora fragariae]|uniref:Uncharacterized protein n=2 Tax=Phytophthora fragariae TaxID=53985 RepID=A0A6A3IUV2_9STRA|nr:hypothetical protein PF011_g20693 [Phytophthora fragariae]